MKLYKKPILNTKKTLNNRIYSIEVLNLIKTQIEERCSTSAFGTLGYKEDMCNEGVLHVGAIAFTYSNPVIENEILYVDIDISKYTYDGKCLIELIKSGSNMVFRTCGYSNQTNFSLTRICHVDLDYKLFSIAAIDSDDDSLVF